jgi:UPF0755 protein
MLFGSGIQSMKLIMSKKRILWIVRILVLAVILPLVHFGFFPATPSGGGKNVRILEFREGYTLKKVARELEQSRIISSALLFTLYVRLLGADEKVKAGAYQFNDGMTPAKILHKLITGEVYERHFAVPEGYSIYQIATLLEQRSLFRKDAFLKQCFNRSLLDDMGIKEPSVEGYLYPGTYDITSHTTEAGLIKEMVAQFRVHFSLELDVKAKELQMSPTGILTLASMVEKEAVAAEERPLIASVFYNRLKKKMPLQSDPTAVYRLRAFAGKITRQDLRNDSPYNTYKISGLPPGPIGNPGRDAIEAVLNPAKTKYLYFVSKMDGTHYFSATLDEHNLAVRKYLKLGAGPSQTVESDVPEYRNDYPVLRNNKP